MIFNTDDKYYLLVHSKKNNEAIVSKLNNVNMSLVQDYYMDTRMTVEGSLSTVKTINLTSIDEITDEDIKNILENQ